MQNLWKLRIDDEREDGRHGFFNYNWSAISVAMQLSLLHLADPETARPIHRTFVNLIFDFQFNARDPM